MQQSTSKLFKDRITRKEYTNLAKELLKAVETGEDALKMLLIGSENPILYSSRGTFQTGDHNRCGGLNKSTFTEKRFCKCIYYRNEKYFRPEECEKCDFMDRFDIIGDFWISDYEVPACFKEPGIGEIDLIITDGKTQYATELKPYKGNNETLLRMISEIMTYTIGYPAGLYTKAIAFFEGTKQASEFENCTPEIKELLKIENITVFNFRKEKGNAYRICKL